MDLEELKNNLSFITNSENLTDQRLERCDEIMAQVEMMSEALNSCGTFGEDGKFVKDTKELDELKGQIVELTERTETAESKFIDLEKKYRDRFFFGGNPQPAEPITHEEYASAIDKLFN